HAVVQMWTRDADGVPPAVRVPGVGCAVLVVVAEVVRLPRVRRHHDGDAVFAEPARAQDERSEGDLATCPQPGEVHARGPVADPDRQARRARVLSLLRDRDSSHFVVAASPDSLGPGPEDLYLDALRLPPEA